MGRRKNPFTPGMGKPPVRADHAEAVGALDSRLVEALGNGPGDMVVLCGPRGNGKTALPLELAQKARDGKLNVRKRAAYRLGQATETVAMGLVSDGGAGPACSPTLRRASDSRKGEPLPDRALRA